MNQPRRDRRYAVFGAVAAALTLGIRTPLHAQERFPNRQLRVVVGSLAGGTTDVAARLLATRLALVFGHPVIVDNKAGAGGIIAGKEVAQARPDGYTLQMGSTSTNTLAPLLQSPTPFDLMADFEPVHVLGFVPLTLFVPNDLPARSLGELIALARASPGKLSYASAGVGTTSHLTGELFKMLADLDIVHVPYRGGPAMDLAVASGEVQLSFDSPGAIAELHQSRKVRALAVLAATRSDQLPDVPTSKEAGFPELVSLVSFYVLAPAKTPQAVLQTLHRGITEAMQNPEAQSELSRRGIQPVTVGSLADARAFVKQEVDRWSRVIQGRNIKVG